MASFEKRFDAAGRLRAIRVKLRLAGLPHISKTVRVVEDSPAAIAEAEAIGRTWVAAALQALAAGRKPALDWKRVGGAPQLSALESPSALGLAWTDATIGVSEPSGGNGDAEVFAVHGKRIGNSDTLLLLLVSAGLRFEEMAALRWRHVRLEAGHLDVPGAAGYVSRQVQLTNALSAALLGHGHRKRGLVMGQGPLEIAERYRALTVRSLAFLDLSPLSKGIWPQEPDAMP